MNEWLTNCLGPAKAKKFLRCYVLEEFGHQDLFWACHAPRVVFPKFLDGLLR